MSASSSSCHTSSAPDSAIGTSSSASVSAVQRRKRHPRARRRVEPDIGELPRGWHRAFRHADAAGGSCWLHVIPELINTPERDLVVFNSYKEKERAKMEMILATAYLELLYL